MKKIVAAMVLAFMTTVAFASTTEIALTKKSTLSNPTSPWYIANATDTVVFTNASPSDLSVQVYVNLDSGKGAPDDVTVSCGAAKYVVHSGDSLVCPVAGNSKMVIQDVNFKIGSNGNYTVLE